MSEVVVNSIAVSTVIHQINSKYPTNFQFIIHPKLCFPYNKIFLLGEVTVFDTSIPEGEGSTIL
jgi:hypothetical protein